MAFRVKARFLENHAFGRQEILSVLNATTNTTPDHIEQDDEGVILFYSTKNDLERLFTPAATSALYDADITLIQPRRFQAERTIFARRVSSWITEHEVDDIVEHISSENSNMTAVSAKIITNRNDTRSTLKVTFTTTAAAVQATTTGFKCFGVNTPPASIHKERYIEVSQCYKCYQYSHVTRKCSEKVFKCSVCAQDHHYKQCKAEFTHCVVCDGKHTAISHLCPVRQDVIKKLLEAHEASKTRQFNVQAAMFPEPPGAGKAAHQHPSQWGPGLQDGSQPANQPPTKLSPPFGSSQSLTLALPRQPVNQPPTKPSPPLDSGQSLTQALPRQPVNQPLTKLSPPPGSSQLPTQASPRQLPETATDQSHLHSPPTSLPDLATYGMVHALTDTAKMVAGSNLQLFVKILNILYSANGLPTFIVPDIVYTILTGATSSHSAPRPVIEVTTDVLTDLLSAAAKPDAASSTPETETPIEAVEPTIAAAPVLVTSATAPPTSKEPSTPTTSHDGFSQPLKAQPFRSLSPDSSESSDGEDSVGTPPSKKILDFLHNITPTKSNDSTAISTRSKINQTEKTNKTTRSRIITTSAVPRKKNK